MALANCLTLLRIFLIPVFITALIYRQLEWALVSFVLAGVTDILDGFVARRTQITSLGRFLDPLADKLLLVSAFVILPMVTSFPIWISVIVVFRDVLLASGYVLIYLKRGSRTISVRWLGKLTTLIQSFCVGITVLEMLMHNFLWVQQLSAYAVAFITILSGLDYSVKAIRQYTVFEKE